MLVLVYFNFITFLEPGNELYGSLPMSCWRDKVEHSVNTVVAEPRVTFDPGLHGENVIVLPFEITHDFGEALCCQSIVPLSDLFLHTWLRCRSGRQNRECRPR